MIPVCCGSFAISINKVPIETYFYVDLLNYLPRALVLDPSYNFSDEWKKVNYQVSINLHCSFHVIMFVWFCYLNLWPDNLCKREHTHTHICFAYSVLTLNERGPSITSINGGVLNTMDAHKPNKKKMQWSS